MDNKILLIEICNYIDYPIGGYTAFAKQMLTAFGNQLVLVGMSEDENTPIGKWIKKEINGEEFDFFSVIKVKKTNKKSFIPGRLKSYWAVWKYKSKILEIGIENVFIQAPEVQFALRNESIKNLCIRIPGVENPLTISRYWYGKYFSKIFDYFFFKILRKSNVILASADNLAINNFLVRGRNMLDPSKVIEFPTRVNTNIFYTMSKNKVRNDLEINLNKKVIVTTGRLSELKGWRFMLESFMIFRETYPDSLFIFLGDGEERKKIEDYIEFHNITEHVLLAGRIEHKELSLFLNSADIFVMGSYFEGWATSLVEAIACAKPVVCTNFSSAKELVENGTNGYVIEKHDENLFAELMITSLTIPEKNLLSKSEEIQKYATSNLKDSILNHWKLI